MKNLLIIEPCLIEGKHYDAGEVLRDVPDKLAEDLVSSGRIVEVKAEEAKKAEPEAVETQDPEPETREPVTEHREPKRGKKH